MIYSWITITAELGELKQQSLHLLSNWLEFTQAIALVPGLSGVCSELAGNEDTHCGTTHAASVGE